MEYMGRTAKDIPSANRPLEENVLAAKELLQFAVRHIEHMDHASKLPLATLLRPVRMYLWEHAEECGLPLMDTAAVVFPSSLVDPCSWGQTHESKEQQLIHTQYEAMEDISLPQTVESVEVGDMLRMRVTRGRDLPAYLDGTVSGEVYWVAAVKRLKHDIKVTLVRMLPDRTRSNTYRMYNVTRYTYTPSGEAPVTVRVKPCTMAKGTVTRLTLYKGMSFSFYSCIID